MKGGAFLSVLLAGVTPLLVVALIVTGTGLGLVLWRPPVLSTDQFVAPGSNLNGVMGVAADNASVYVGGYFNATGWFTGIPFMRKYDFGGNIVWSTSLPNLSGYTIVSVAVGNGTSFSLGEGVYNDTLLGFDAKGNTLWAHELNGISIAAIYATTNVVYLAGRSHTRLTNQSFTGIVEFVRKYDLAGNALWTSEFSNSSSVINQVCVDSSGIYVLTDSSLVKYDSSGNEDWALPVEGTGLSGDATGVYVSGFMGASLYSIPYGFLDKYDQNGNPLWSSGFDSPDNSGVGRSSLAMDSSGVYLSMGSVAGNGFVMKYDQNGHQLWSFRTPISPTQLVPQATGFLVATGGGGFYLAGSSVSPIGTSALVQQFGQSPSLIFFGINPPWSFVIITALVVVAAISVLLFRRRYVKRMAMRPKSTSSDRFLPRHS